LLRAAQEFNVGRFIRWDLLILLALNTGMRRGELLNTTWQDIDFERMTIDVSPKKDTQYTWEWHIKDTERRKLPLTEEIVKLLVEHQAEQPDEQPYVFIPPSRYDHIQRRRSEDKWTVEHGRCPLSNFTRHFHGILRMAGLGRCEFHDLRRTCLSNWLSNGLTEFDVMNLAGHSSFETTHSFYLNIRRDLVDRARVATEQALQLNSGARWCKGTSSVQKTNSPQM